MFNNIGKKIKTLAKVLCWIGISASVMGGIFTMMLASDIDDILFIIGLLIIVLGPLVSWVSSFSLYALGEIVVKLTEISDNISSAPGISSNKSNIKVKNEIKSAFKTDHIMDIPKRKGAED